MNRPGQPERPVLFVIDDEVGVVHAMSEDLGRRFSQDFRIVGETSAADGLRTLRDLAGAREPVALLIVDHDMIEMPGVDFLAKAHELHPLAKRVLLVERDYSVAEPPGQRHDPGPGRLPHHQAVDARAGSVPPGQ